MLKKYTDFMDSNIYLNAAVELGYQISVIDFKNMVAQSILT